MKEGIAAGVSFQRDMVELVAWSSEHVVKRLAEKYRELPRRHCYAPRACSAAGSCKMPNSSRHALCTSSSSGQTPGTKDSFFPPPLERDLFSYCPLEVNPGDKTAFGKDHRAAPSRYWITEPLLHGASSFHVLREQGYDSISIPISMIDSQKRIYQA